MEWNDMADRVPRIIYVQWQPTQFHFTPNNTCVYRYVVCSCTYVQMNIARNFTRQPFGCDRYKWSQTSTDCTFLPFYLLFALNNFRGFMSIFALLQFKIEKQYFVAASTTLQSHLFTSNRNSIKVLRVSIQKQQQQKINKTTLV